MTLPPIRACARSLFTHQPRTALVAMRSKCTLVLDTHADPSRSFAVFSVYRLPAPPPSSWLAGIKHLPPIYLESEHDRLLRPPVLPAHTPSRLIGYLGGKSPHQPIDTPHKPVLIRQSGARRERTRRTAPPNFGLSNVGCTKFESTQHGMFPWALKHKDQYSLDVLTHGGAVAPALDTTFSDYTHQAIVRNINLKASGHG